MSKVKIEFQVVEARGQKFELGSDGKLYRNTSGFARARVPITEQEFRGMTGMGSEKVGNWDGATLYEWDKEWMPPRGMVAFVRNALKEATDGEAQAYLCGRERKDGTKKWIAVVPVQEVTAGSVDVDEDDMDKMLAHWEGAGWRVAEQVHLHPERMETASGTDLDDWAKAPGMVYSVAPRDSEELGLYIGVGGVVFDLGVEEAVAPVSVRIRAWDGSKDWEECIEEKKWLSVYKGGRPTGYVGYGHGPYSAYATTGGGAYDAWDEEVWGEAWDKAEEERKKKAGSKGWTETEKVSSGRKRIVTLAEWEKEMEEAGKLDDKLRNGKLESGDAARIAVVSMERASLVLLQDGGVAVAGWLQKELVGAPWEYLADLLEVVNVQSLLYIKDMKEWADEVQEGGG